MNLRAVQRRCGANPFRAFTVTLANGKTIPVKGPEFVLFAPNGEEAVVYGPDDSYNLVEAAIASVAGAPRSRKTGRK